ncbi:hypothetical protein IAR55_006635 [Kwoniella newhampshirensis]|uniref:Phytase-like domain-containing protein n=1 Tax=Kwoniella newhampshirensis TaxID=1651941 RepID=A0AAW0YHZ7_9TREE
MLVRLVAALFGAFILVESAPTGSQAHLSIDGGDLFGSGVKIQKSNPLDVAEEDKRWSIPTIDTWALNPIGDAAVIRVSTTDPETALTTYDLHLLAINAQFTISSVHQGPTPSNALYTFLSDTTLITLSPSAHQTSDGLTASEDNEGQVWKLSSRILNYTTAPPAFPPSISNEKVMTTLRLKNDPIKLVFSSEVGILSVMTPGEDGGLLLLEVVDVKAGEWKVKDRVGRPLEKSGMIIDEVVASGTRIALTEHGQLEKAGVSSHNALYTLDLQDGLDGPLRLISDHTDAIASSPAFGPEGMIAWLEQREGGQKKLWMMNGDDEKWEVQIKNWNMSPSSVLFSKNGEAINLLVSHPDPPHPSSLYHLWTPTTPSKPPVTPVRIPSPLNMTIRSAIHVGITPLDHSHLIGVMSPLTEEETGNGNGNGKELWVISHSPHEDPTGNYENIRLTYLTEQRLHS